MCVLVVSTLECDDCGAARSLRSSMSEAEDMQRELRIDAIEMGWQVLGGGRTARCPSCYARS